MTTKELEDQAINTLIDHYYVLQAVTRAKCAEELKQHLYADTIKSPAQIMVVFEELCDLAESWERK